MMKKHRAENSVENSSVEETAKSNLDAVKEEMEEQQNHSTVDELREKIEKLEEEKQEYSNKFMRMTADFQNYKKRIEKEKSDIYSFANEKLILDLLPIVDNLERAVESCKNDEKEEGFMKGVEMILQQFLDILKKNGVEEIKALGENFDHNYHHAVLREDSAEHESNIVLDVLQKGYSLNDKVIRPSMVKVSG